MSKKNVFVSSGVTEEEKKIIDDTHNKLVAEARAMSDEQLLKGVNAARRKLNLPPVTSVKRG
jgi:hypothetical protein